MDGPAAFLALRWMLYDTLRQAWASGLVAALALVTALCVVLCLSVTIEGDAPDIPGPDRPEWLPEGDRIAASLAVAAVVADAVGQAHGVWPVPATWRSREYRDVEAALRHMIQLPGARMTLAFGAVPVRLARDRVMAVRTLQCLLAGMVADAAGILLGLMWTAGFLPAFLDARAASVLLAKPVPRGVLLTGKVLGVVLVVGAMALLFVATTWLALGVRTGVWAADYWLCVPVLLLHFAVFYAASALIAVATRSTVLCLSGAVGLWLLCWAVNVARHAAVSSGGAADWGLEAAYWTLPKPLDFHILLTDVLRAEDFLTHAVDRKGLVDHGGWWPEAALASSAAAGAAALAAAVVLLRRAEA